MTFLDDLAPEGEIHVTPVENNKFWVYVTSGPGIVVSRQFHKKRRKEAMAWAAKTVEEITVKLQTQSKNIFREGFFTP